MASRSEYLDRLATLPALQRCSRRELTVVARLVDEVVVAPGAPLEVGSGDLTLALEPTRVLIVNRRAVPALLELVPHLLDPPSVVRARDQRLRLIPACSRSSA